MTDTTLHTPAAEAVVTLSFDEAQALLERAVEEKGRDYTYEMHKDEWGHPLCLYFDPTTEAPSCLVGHVLAYKGVTFDDLDDAEANRMTDVDDLAAKGIIAADDETVMLLLTAQSEQDGGQSWGEALDEALDTYEDRLAARREHLSGKEDYNL